MDAAFRSAQSRWDNMLPPEPDDEWTESELSEATDEFLIDTWATSDWLCQNLKQPELSTTDIREWAWAHKPEQIDVFDATLDQLWALMMSGTQHQCLAARDELRDRMVKACRDQIEARVPAIRASNLQAAREYAAELAAEAA